ncbi:hypothetical protein FACS1894152_6510 [Bacilli bacterium]|nr:hypothetical protein FACS1894152_6510 [Bacilli bacterium]
MEKNITDTELDKFLNFVIAKSVKKILSEPEGALDLYTNHFALEKRLTDSLKTYLTPVIRELFFKQNSTWYPATVPPMAIEGRYRILLNKISEITGIGLYLKKSPSGKIEQNDILLYSQIDEIPKEVRDRAIPYSEEINFRIFWEIFENLGTEIFLHNRRKLFEEGVKYEPRHPTSRNEKIEEELESFKKLEEVLKRSSSSTGQLSKSKRKQLNKLTGELDSKGIEYDDDSIKELLRAKIAEIRDAIKHNMRMIPQPVNIVVMSKDGVEYEVREQLFISFTGKNGTALIEKIFGSIDNLPIKPFFDQVIREGGTNLTVDSICSGVFASMAPNAVIITGKAIPTRYILGTSEFPAILGTISNNMGKEERFKTNNPILPFTNMLPGGSVKDIDEDVDENEDTNVTTMYINPEYVLRKWSIEEKQGNLRQKEQKIKFIDNLFGDIKDEVDDVYDLLGNYRKYHICELKIRELDERLMSIPTSLDEAKRKHLEKLYAKKTPAEIAEIIARNELALKLQELRLEDLKAQEVAFKRQQRLLERQSERRRETMRSLDSSISELSESIVMDALNLTNH